MNIIEPFNGAVLNHLDGQETNDSLTITVRGRAHLEDRVLVNGQLAQRSGAEFTAQVVLRQEESEIVASVDPFCGRREQRVRVVWDKASHRRYRMCIDDNVFCLRDIAMNRYKSLFECPYLKILRDLHEKYGTKYTVNLFFQTPEADFSLDQFPDKYKGEFEGCGDWLKLAFHAYKEFPDRPYQYADAKTLAHDFDAVAAEIHRFAGAAAYAQPTIIHWCMVQPDCLKVLTDRGVKVLSTLAVERSGGWDLNYFLNDQQCRWLLRGTACVILHPASRSPTAISCLTRQSSRTSSPR